MKSFAVSALGASLVCGFAVQTDAQSNEELAKQLSNPIANLISVTFQLN